MKNRSALLLLFLLSITSLKHINGQVIWDSSFNGTGTTTRMYYPGSSSVSPIGLYAKMHLLTSTGRILAAGSVNGYYSGYAFGYRDNGAIDPAVGTLNMVEIPMSNDNIRMTATLGDTIFVLGKGVDWSSGAEFVTVTKMDALGNLITDFGTGGQIHVPILMSGFNFGCTPLAITVQADGKIVIAANANITFATSQLLRFMPNGAVDPTFGTGGVVTLYIASCGYTVNSIFPLPDNKILITGDFRHIASTQYFSACRFLNNGTFDSTFADSGYAYNYLGFNGHVLASVLQPDGKVIVGGTQAIRYNTDGSVDATFGTSGVYYPPLTIAAMQQDAAGRIYMLGSNTTNKLWRTSLDGHTDLTFNGTGIYSFSFGSTVNDARSLSLYPQGKILMYGDYRDPDYNYHLYFARVNIRPIVEHLGTPPPYCTGDAVQLYCHALGSIRWYNGPTLLSDTGKLITVLTPGTYVAVATLGSMSDTSDATTITFDPIPAAGVISGADSICIAASATLTASAIGGTWTSSATAIATVSSIGVVTGIAGGTATITYTVTNGCGGAIAAKIITVNPMLPANITGLATVCTGSTTTLSDATTGGTWACGSIAIATVGSSSGIVTGLSSGTATISYTVTNPCGSSTVLTTITVNTVPSAAAITGTSTVCVGSTITLADATTGGAWTTSAPAIATVGLSTGIVSAISVGAATISYTITNSCGSATATKPITINPLPNAGTITGTSSACAGSTITLADATIGGAWTTSAPAIATVGLFTGVVSAISVGTATISYTITNSCGSATATKIITISPLPNAATISGPATVCTGSIITLTDLVSGGSWSASNTNASVSGAGVVHGITSGIVTITYSVTNSCGTATATREITVNTLPDAGTIVGLDSVCVRDTILLSDAISGGIWSATNGHVIVFGTGMIYGTSTGLDTIVYTITNTCGTANAKLPIVIKDCITEVNNIEIPESELIIYPNPTQNDIIIIAPTNIDNIDIFNLTGQRVFSGTYNTNIATISLGPLPANVYLLRINNRVYKVTKQ